jgi:hypothetical protein
MRAVSFASAMAACFVAVRASNCTSHGRRAPLRSACRITAMGPTTSIWRRYRLPALLMPPGRTLLPEEFAIVLAVPYASYCLDKSEWSPEGDYFPEGDRLLMFKPEVHTAEWSVT